MNKENKKKGPFTERIIYLLMLGMGVKLLIDTTIQIFNPFLTMISSGLGVSVVTMGSIVALRGAMGLTSPLMGSIADRIGHKKVMQAGLFFSGTGMLLAGLSNSIALFTFAIVLTGIGQAGFTPNLHAYLSTKLPYEKRAMGIGIIEYSWAFAGIAGLFAAGFLIERYSWRAPFILIGILLNLAVLLYFTLPREQIEENISKRQIPDTSRFSLLNQIYDFFSLGPYWKSAWGTIVVQGLNMFAIMHVMIIHGGWLSGEYGLDPSSLGVVAFLFGVCDLSASVLVSLKVDKIGKKKSVIIGVAGMTAGFAVMPFLNVGLVFAVIGLAVPRIFFEFATVSNLALLTEQVPSNRGKVMSLSTAVGLIGITSASAMGPVTYVRMGVMGLSVISFIAGFISFIIMLMVVKEKPGSSWGKGVSRD